VDCCCCHAGEDFDVSILNKLIGDFKAETGIDLSGDRLAMQRLREVSKLVHLACFKL
jgi:molecular chaperone DnaK (HSP70)